MNSKAVRFFCKKNEASVFDFLTPTSFYDNDDNSLLKYFTRKLKYFTNHVQFHLKTPVNPLKQMPH